MSYLSQKQHITKNVEMLLKTLHVKERVPLDLFKFKFEQDCLFFSPSNMTAVILEWKQ